MRSAALLVLLLSAAGCAGSETIQATEETLELSFQQPLHTASSNLHFSKLSTHGAALSRRSAPSTAILNHDLLAFGGVLDDFSTKTNVFYNDLHRLDLRTSAWSRVDTSHAPSARAFAPAVSDVARDRVLVFGGSNYDAAFKNVTMFDDLWALTEHPFAWTEVQTRNQGPSSRSGAALWIAGNRLFVFGGVESTFAMKNDLWALDLRSLVWTQLIANGVSGSPEGRHVAQVTPTPSLGRVTLYGGEGLDPNTFKFTELSDTWQFDLQMFEWINVTPPPDEDLVPSRNYSASAVLGGNLYVFGGDLPDGTSGCSAPFEQNVTNEVWAFDLRKHVWSPQRVVGTTPPSLKRMGYAALGKSLYVVGGWDFSCTNDQGPGQIWNTDVYTLHVSGQPM